MYTLQSGLDYSYECETWRMWRTTRNHEIATYKFAISPLTDVKMVSDWVNNATLDQLKCFIMFDTPLAASTSLDTVLKNLGKSLVLER